MLCPRVQGHLLGAAAGLLVETGVLDGYSHLGGDGAEKGQVAFVIEILLVIALDGHHPNDLAPGDNGGAHPGAGRPADDADALLGFEGGGLALGPKEQGHLVADDITGQAGFDLVAVGRLANALLQRKDPDPLVGFFLVRGDVEAARI